MKKTAAPVPAPSQPRVEIDGEVTRRIRQHARAHMKTEVCGVLIGDDLAGSIAIRASIEALTANQAGTHVTFTQDAWEEIYKVKDEKFPDDRIVGWYHSHPGFGVFLSEHDLFIQQNFFSSPGQVAWVYDPHSDEEGCFGWVGGEIRRLSSLHIADTSGGSVDRSPRLLEPEYSPTAGAEVEEDLEPAPSRKPPSQPSPRAAKLLRWAGALFTHLSALLVGFLVSYFLFPRFLAIAIDPATGQLIVRDGSALVRRYLEQEAGMPGRTLQPSPAPASPVPASPAPGPAPAPKPAPAGAKP